MGPRFLTEVADATVGYQVIMVAPPTMEVPDHVLRMDRVPQLALMSHMNTVITHGGHNTVCEALAHGLPLVVAPIRDDQPVVARQVVDAGAGVRVKYARVRAPEIRVAVDEVLHNPDYAAGARRVQRSFEAAGGAVTAAEHLEAVV
ncbi:hypothetical protein GCM10029964_048280 [Kibdelosporangium lantanae]